MLIQLLNFMHSLMFENSHYNYQLHQHTSELNLSLNGSKENVNLKSKAEKEIENHYLLQNHHSSPWSPIE